MPRKKPQSKKRYSTEFKLNGVRMTFNPGKTVQEVASELGISLPSLSKWRHEFKSKQELKEAEEGLSAKQGNDRLKAELN